MKCASELKKVFSRLKNENQGKTEFEIYHNNEAWNAITEMVTEQEMITIYFLIDCKKSYQI